MLKTAVIPVTKKPANSASDKALIAKLVKQIRSYVQKYGTVKDSELLEQAIADAPAPFTTILISLIDFLDISKAFIKAAKVIIAVPC